jgi:hypothetical protein
VPLFHKFLNETNRLGRMRYTVFSSPNPIIDADITMLNDQLRHRLPVMPEAELHIHIEGLSSEHGTWLNLRGHMRYEQVPSHRCCRPRPRRLDQYAAALGR